ncbi:uncharacterized protein LOC104889657 isoform X2 [Beta vulgaris subsp. vulgaris]|uniref:uncharacterized protein LOC104889657 isoform X2 n=1 Tax=Beta vulgaris subsp. vulgaris TaxID=3555 RepID=UPI000900BD2B|nr:uncharacterized protein LOC104889657 isoform X2 [Beta vulgaris subsp. vulgaris]
MVNPRRSSYVSSGQSSENPFQTQSFSLSSILNLLKKPQAFPFLLSIFILLTWVSLKFQHSSHFSPLYQNPKKWSKDEDLKANLIRFLPSKLAKKDKRGGAVSCASVHVGEIRPGGIRGNHRHYTCNETFIIWGARIKFRLENSQVVDKGYAEVEIGADEVAVASSPSGTAHALVNVDPIRTAFLLGCQDNIVNYNSSSSTAFNIWNDL